MFQKYNICFWVRLWLDHLLPKIFHDQCLACVLMRSWQSCYDPGHTSRGHRKGDAAQVLFMSFNKSSWMLSIAKWQALISAHLIVVYFWTQNLLSVSYLKHVLDGNKIWMNSTWKCEWASCIVLLRRVHKFLKPLALLHAHSAHLLISHHSYPKTVILKIIINQWCL